MRPALAMVLAGAIAAALAAGQERAAAPPAAPGDVPRFEVNTDRGTFKVGEPVHLQLELVAPPGAEVELPGPAVELGPFELLHREVLGPEPLAGGMSRHVARLTVTAYARGSATLPPLVALVRSPDGTVRSLQSDSLTLGIESVLPAAGADTADIRPLKRPIELKGGRPWWLLAVALALLALLAVALARRRRRGLEPAVQVFARDPRPADEVALDALEALRRERLAARGRVKEHYIRLTDILRPYLERRFGIPALDLTTEEILAGMAAHIDGERRAPLRSLERLLAEADLVKFARFLPPAPLAEGAIDEAADFIRATAAPRLPPSLGGEAGTEARDGGAALKPLPERET